MNKNNKKTIVFHPEVSEKVRQFAEEEGFNVVINKYVKNKDTAYIIDQAAFMSAIKFPPFSGVGLRLIAGSKSAVEAAIEMEIETVKNIQYQEATGMPPKVATITEAQYWINILHRRTVVDAESINRIEDRLKKLEKPWWKRR